MFTFISKYLSGNEYDVHIRFVAKTIISNNFKLIYVA